MAIDHGKREFGVNFFFPAMPHLAGPAEDGL
jgi:hypothetical protein